MSTGRLLRRVVWIGSNAVLAVAALVALFGWIALNVRWEVPDAPALSGPSVITARDGTVLARFNAAVERRVVTRDRVSDAAIDAVVAHEDAEFFTHQGVDLGALLRAVVTNVRTGDIRQGGSTITQQYVKNAFVSRERTILRKVREAVISIQLERDLSKDAILERYLNAVYFGEGAHGIEAAALTYFGVRAAELTPAQGATLAQLLPAPSRRNPRVDPEGALARRDALLDRMVHLGLLGPAEAEAEKATELEIVPRRRVRMGEPYFTSYVRQQVEAAFGEEAILTGALRIRTTLDLDAQRKLLEAVGGRLPEVETGVEAGGAVVEPTTGEILAIYGGRDFYGDTSRYSAKDYSQVNLATQGIRQPGSTFKPFVLLAAMEQGIEPTEVYPAPARISFPGWNVRNADRSSYGSLTLHEALVHSVNTVYAQLGVDVGPEAVLDVASRLGVRAQIAPVTSVALGGTDPGPTVLDMASAFATLANDGLACPARSILEITGPDGEAIAPPPERSPPPQVLEARPEELKDQDRAGCYQAVDRDMARTVTQALEDVVARGTGRRAGLGRPQAGKTGTTQENRDAWFVGYTPQLSLALWLGDPDENRELAGIAGFDRVFGGSIPALMWRDAAEALLEDLPPVAFPEPGELGQDERRVGPAMSRDRPPSPTPTPTPSSTETPTESEPEPSPSPTDDDDGPCLPIVEDCP
ncbi:MAG: transglycosylase domain-containing protein [Nitriliruptorales bacterium]